MSTPLRAVTDGVSPEYGVFSVAEVINGRLAGSAVNGEIEPPGDDRVAAGDDGLVIQVTSAYTDTAHVRFELWDEPPPVDAWKELWTGRLLSKSGLVGAGAWASSYAHDVEFDLGRSDTTWSARVATKILQTEQEAGFPYAIARVELYKIQFWN
ncbi:hypothetical protein [Microtetraspora fusca]|uniref:hypothetical protein n=1 Tax=Microtetraspora fusca TaxID=1997 RepID=UPI0012F9D197|nr:hypothetical protein [Microtetraspora fusca]